MSGKKKKPTSSWVQCDTCGVIAADRDGPSHAQDCPPDPNKSSYPCVNRNLLYCSLDVHSNKDSTVVNVPTEDLDSLVFMSSAALQFCGIPMGDPVVICSLKKDKTTYVRRAWRSHDRQQLTASLLENDLEISGFSIGDSIVIRHLTEAVLPAYEIFLKSETDEEENSEVLVQLQQLCRSRIFCAQNRIAISYYGKRKIFQIARITGFNDRIGKFYKALPDTTWCLDKTAEGSEEKSFLQRIGGLKIVLSELNEILAMTMASASSHDLLKTRGILLHGPHGTGKTLLMKALVQKWAKTVVNVSSSGLITPDFDKHLERLFTRAQRGAPSILTIDDVDVLCGKSGNRSGQEGNMASALAAIFDRLHYSKTPIVVIATTNDVNSVDRCLRRPERFDKEIEVGVPTPQERLEVLEALLGEEPHSVAQQELKTVADSAHGFVGADLAALLTKAVTMAARENSSLLGRHILTCLPLVRPSAMREIMVQVPNVRWEDIGGQKELKHQLCQAVEWPLKYPESFRRLGVSPPRGVLMYGPPGCSKTMVAKALATESGLNFISVKGPELFSKWVGESEKAVREVFRRARQAAPSIVFFDELDALAGERTAASGGAQVQERVLAQLLTELDGVEALGHVIVVGATNRPDRIDPALLRPGRLDRVVHVPLPDHATRSDIFRIQFRKTPIAENVVLSELADLTAGYSGAEVVAVCNEAAMLALDENMEAKSVARKHFLAALQIVTPRTSQNYLQLCERYKNLTIKTS